MAPSHVEGLDNLIRKLTLLEDSVAADNLGKIVLAGGFVLEGIVKQSMGTQKHGRRYGTHVASAPGEAPAIDMGALVTSIHSELVSASRTKAQANVFTNSEYAPPLEFGSAHAAARPFMRPAADEHQAEVSAAGRAVAEQLINGAAHA